MYNIIQLNEKSLSELQAIAQELGIKKTDSFKKEDLVYKILDEQAIAGATKKVAAEKIKEERKVEKQEKRTRTTKKKENTDKAFTAGKSTDSTKAKTTATSAKVQPVEAVNADDTEKAPEAAENPTPEKAETTAAPAKRKPGRPRKVKTEDKNPAPAVKQEKAKAELELAFETEPQTATSAMATPQTSTPNLLEENDILSDSEDDFIPIEDLPTEKVELPSELLGKFEATKAETPMGASSTEPSPAAPQRQRIRTRDNNNSYNNNNNNNNNGTNTLLNPVASNLITSITFKHKGKVYNGTVSTTSLECVFGDENGNYIDYGTDFSSINPGEFDIKTVNGYSFTSITTTDNYEWIASIKLNDDEDTVVEVPVSLIPGELNVNSILNGITVTLGDTVKQIKNDTKFPEDSSLNQFDNSNTDFFVNYTAQEYINAGAKETDFTDNNSVNLSGLSNVKCSVEQNTFGPSNTTANSAVAGSLSIENHNNSYWSIKVLFEDGSTEYFSVTLGIDG